ncbi:MAG: TadE/TadG family type IV pilus assembly protein [Myxococcota bacterium]
MPKLRHSGARRGANAIEFALVAPVLVAMIGGLVDYGWYFWREALLVNGFREATRAGGLQSAATTETGGTCTTCVTMATTSANAALTSQGYSGVTVTPTIERVPASGTPCTYAVVIDTTVPHERIFSLVPGPTEIHVRMVSMAQNLTCE